MEKWNCQGKQSKQCVKGNVKYHVRQISVKSDTKPRPLLNKVRVHWVCLVRSGPLFSHAHNKKVNYKILYTYFMYFTANGPTFRIGVISTQTSVITAPALGFQLTYNQVAC